jgi:hypothetical protein
MKINRSSHPHYENDHVAITHIYKEEGWIRIGYSGIEISILDVEHLNIIGVDLYEF